MRHLLIDSEVQPAFDVFPGSVYHVVQPFGSRQEARIRPSLFTHELAVELG